MDMFGRDMAPISTSAFAAIEARASASLKANLTARRFACVKGPLGWNISSVPAGRIDRIQKEGGISFGLRVGIPLLEARVDFELGIHELACVGRGAEDLDLTAVERAAVSISAFEDKVVYRGVEKAGIAGMRTSSWYPPLELPRSDPESFVHAVTVATDAMKTGQSIGGPYALVGGHAIRDVLGRFVGSRTMYEVLKKNTDVTDYIFTPSYDGSFLVSTRGGDLTIYIGGDFTVGYSDREGDALRFYLAESFAFRILEPRAFRVIDLK
jgi:uncharacterized linocin/CFP29 family protein